MPVNRRHVLQQSGERRLIKELAALHRECPALLRGLLVAGEMVEEAERWAGDTFDEAAQRPGDEEAADRAVAAASKSDSARQAEFEAVARWVHHRERVEVLVERAAAFSPSSAVCGHMDTLSGPDLA